MTNKNDYSASEWELLLRAPVLAGTYIMIADLSVTAMAKEMKGMYEAIISLVPPIEAEELITSLVADIKVRAENREKLPELETKDDADPQAQTLDQLGQVLALLEEKAPQEKEGFSAWLMGVAQATAEAGKEGGFLGIGAVRVSDKEKAALEKLQRYFGLNPTL